MKILTSPSSIPSVRLRSESVASWWSYRQPEEAAEATLASCDQTRQIHQFQSHLICSQSPMMRPMTPTAVRRLLQKASPDQMGLAVVELRWLQEEVPRSPSHPCA